MSTENRCIRCGYDLYKDYKDYAECPRCGAWIEVKDRCIHALERARVLVERHGPKWLGVKVSDNLWLYGQPGQKGCVSARVVCGYVDCAVWWADHKQVHKYLSGVWDIECPDHDTRYFEWCPETRITLEDLIKEEIEKDLPFME